MCGIAGILRLTPPGEAARAALDRTPFDAIPEKWLDLLDESIRHRGPDGQGRFRDRAVRADGTVVDVALVHRRLSIIDHTGGAQPMVSQRGPGASLGQPSALPFHPLLFHGKPDAPVHYHQLPDLPDTLAVVFNGCIYNHRDLRRELESAGHRFTTDHSDTEVLLHGWREWKHGLAHRVDGMFAQATWDRSRATMVWGCDSAGEKPLHLLDNTWQTEDGFVAAFSSVAASLQLIHSFVRSKPLKVERLDLWRWIEFGFGPSAPLWGAKRMFPGTTSTQRGLMLGGKPTESIAAEAAVYRPVRGERAVLNEDRVDRLVKEAVISRLESDVPLGCFLSGGVDSSLVALHAKGYLGRLQTFSVKMPDTRFDESVFAAAAAQHIGTEHHQLDCDAKPADDLVRLIQQIGLPLGDSSLLPSYWVSRAASSHVRVAVGGDGGDELFGGYERYRAGQLLFRYRRLRRFVPNLSFSRRASRSKAEKVTRFVAAARGEGYPDLVKLFTRAESLQLGHPFPNEPAPSFAALDNPECVSDQPFPESAHPAGLVFYPGEIDPPRWDFAFYLPDDLMCKVDSASMANPLEVRAPFLSKALVDACLAEPLFSLMPRGQRKGLLRAVARRHLPAHIVDRPKMGFAIPIGEWFRSDYGGLRTLLLDHMNSAEPFGPPSLGIDLNMAYVRQMLDEHLGTGKSGLVTRDHSQRLYMLLVLSIWARWLGSLRA